MNFFLLLKSKQIILKLPLKKSVFPHSTVRTEWRSDSAHNDEDVETTWVGVKKTSPNSEKHKSTEM